VNSEDLRQLQAPLKKRYQADAKSAVITLKARGELDSDDIVCRVETGSIVITLKARGELDNDAIVCRVETGKALIEAGLHPATGGTGALACSGNMLLDALVACAGVTLKSVATAISFDLRGGVVSVEGDLDFRGTLGVAKDAPVEFRDIRLVFELDTPEPQERIDQLVKLTERYCVVYQTLARPTAVGLTVRPLDLSHVVTPPGFDDHSYV